MEEVLIHDFIDDKRNHLYKSFIKFVDWFKPKAIVMENVYGMVSYKNGRVVEQIKEDFKNAGYPNAEYRILNAIEYGVPQFQKENFLYCYKKQNRYLVAGTNSRPKIRS